MSASELRYLIALNELYDGTNGVKLTSIADKMCVSKVSVYKALERLEKSGYVKRTENNKICVSEKGALTLSEYTACMSVIQQSLEKYCNLSPAIAYKDALNTICALGDECRRAILGYLKEKGQV